MMMVEIRVDVAALNVQHKVLLSERSLAEGNASAVPRPFDHLQKRDLVYMGRLPPPKGEPQALDSWEDREQFLFRSSLFGDDIDRALKKSDGSYTYFASDIAYH